MYHYSFHPAFIAIVPYEALARIAPYSCKEFAGSSYPPRCLAWTRTLIERSIERRR